MASTEARPADFADHTAQTPTTEKILSLDEKRDGIVDVGSVAAAEEETAAAAAFPFLHPARNVDRGGRRVGRRGACTGTGTRTHAAGARGLGIRCQCRASELGFNVAATFTTESHSWLLLGSASLQ